jgi:hypothetical protein
MSIQQTVTAESPKPATATDIPRPVTAPASPAKVRTTLYPYITGELRRIGILAVIILVILIVLALVLP